MSSRILSGASAAAPAAVDWPRVERPAADAVRPQPHVPPAPVSPDAELEDRIAQAREQAFREGETAGAQKASARLDPVLARLAQTIEQIAAMRSKVRREAEEDVVKLALAIARRVLYRELSIDPEAILGLVKAALDRLDAREIHRLRVSSADAELLRRRLNLPAAIEIAADVSLERGAAIFETTRGHLDASVQTQLAEIERGFADVVRR